MGGGGGKGGMGWGAGRHVRVGAMWHRQTEGRDHGERGKLGWFRRHRGRRRNVAAGGNSVAVKRHERARRQLESLIVKRGRAFAGCAYDPRVEDVGWE